MLHAEPTKKGTGLALFGHADDLKSLHETIHFLCDGITDPFGQNEHALSVAYEVRKAFERQRLVVDTASGTQFGAQFVWPHIIFYASFFRQLAARRPTTKAHQSNLWRLEHCLETALVEYDAKIGNEVIATYPPVGAVSRGFLPGYVSDVVYSFLYNEGSGKMRFRRLPSVIKSMFEWSPEYREYAAFLEGEAKRHGCSAHQLRDTRDWPAIAW